MTHRLLIFFFPFFKGKKEETGIVSASSVHLNLSVFNSFALSGLNLLMTFVFFAFSHWSFLLSFLHFGLFLFCLLLSLLFMNILCTIIIIVGSNLIHFYCYRDNKFGFLLSGILDVATSQITFCACLYFL